MYDFILVSITWLFFVACSLIAVSTEAYNEAVVLALISIGGALRDGFLYVGECIKGSKS